MSQTRSSGPRLLVAGAIVIAAGAAGYLAYRLSGAAAPEASLRPVAADAATPATASDAPAQAEAAAEPAPRKIPATLPDITLADRDGKPTALASFAGRPLLVNFWATWCAPCRREIPLLNKIRAERQAQNAEIVGIAVDFKDKVAEFTQTTRIDYPLLIGEEDGLAAADAFGIGMGFPASVFVDSKNRILTVKLGELHEDELNFVFDRLQDIDSGKLTLEAAQAQVATALREMAAQRAQQKTPDAHEAHE